MEVSTFLQIFLLVDVFIIGVLAPVMIRHGKAHFRPEKHLAEPARPQAADYHLPAAVKEKLLHDSQVQFQNTVDRSAAQLQHDLETTGSQVNTLLMRLATELVNGELERYRKELVQLQKQAKDDMEGVKTEITAHEAELKAKLAEEMAAEKQRLIKQLDTKLADAVGSFLTETLQHDVDLGSQSSYLIAMLEEHKADFTREVADEA